MTQYNFSLHRLVITIIYIFISKCLDTVVAGFPKKDFDANLETAVTEAVAHYRPDRYKGR